MPAGNLFIVHQPTGEIIATGQKTVRQCEKSILKHMTSLAPESTSEDVVSSYQVLTPYKGFGEKGIKAFSISKTDLIGSIEEPTTLENPPIKTVNNTERTL